MKQGGAKTDVRPESCEMVEGVILFLLHFRRLSVDLKFETERRRRQNLCRCRHQMSSSSERVVGFLQVRPPGTKQFVRRFSDEKRTYWF